MGLFGNFFDFDGDGKASLFEELLGLEEPLLVDVLLVDVLLVDVLPEALLAAFLL